MEIFSTSLGGGSLINHIEVDSWTCALLADHGRNGLVGIVSTLWMITLDVGLTQMQLMSFG